MPNSKENSASQHQSLLISALEETSKKVSSAVIPSVEEHVNSDKFDSSDGLDFLDTKNGILLSYMIDLTQLLKLKASKNNDPEKMEACLNRLREMKIVLEKTRPLEKKMRYQLDKLLALSASSAAFSSANTAGRNDGDDTHNSDPLAFRPNPESLVGKDEDEGEASDNVVDDDDGDASSSEEEDDEELMAAKAALNAGRSKKKRASDDSDEDNDVEGKGVYKAPRLAAVPFMEKEKQADKEERMLKKQRDRMRKSEFLSTLKATFGDAPEEDDYAGGAALGKQRESSRRFADKMREKDEYEEDAMIRLTITKKEKQMRKKIMREELSNLNSIADLGNIAAGVTAAFGSDNRKDRDGSYDLEGSSGRHMNGKRRRDDDFGDNSNPKKEGTTPHKNSFQKALFGMEGGSGGKKKRKGRK
jgi:hypothetical protein